MCACADADIAFLFGKFENPSLCVRERARSGHGSSHCPAHAHRSVFIRIQNEFQSTTKKKNTRDATWVMSSAAGNVLVDNVKKWRARTTIANDPCAIVCAPMDGTMGRASTSIRPSDQERIKCHSEYSRALNGSLHLHLGVVCPRVFFSSSFPLNQRRNV